MDKETRTSTVVMGIISAIIAGSATLASASENSAASEDKTEAAATLSDLISKGYVAVDANGVLSLNSSVLSILQSYNLAGKTISPPASAMGTGSGGGGCLSPTE